jgi:hypothetical protein
MRWRDEIGPAHLSAVVRVGLALLLLDETIELWRTLAQQPLGDTFTWPMLPAALLPSRTLFMLLVAGQLVLAALILVGRLARPALLLAALFQLYVILSDRDNYHNYRYTFALALGLLALTPCDRALCPGREATSGPLWAQRLLQLQVSIIYFASGGSKLADADWRSGRVISAGIGYFSNLAIARGVPAEVIAFLMGTRVAAALAQMTIATELGLGVGLWSRRLRPLALWLGLVFHLTIQLVSSVAIFSWLMILLYALFARPTLHERVVQFAPQQHRLIQVLRALDWLARFRFTPGERFCVIDRDGRAAGGAEARALIARATPLLFIAWPPLWLWARGWRRGRH